MSVYEDDKKKIKIKIYSYFNSAFEMRPSPLLSIMANAMSKPATSASVSLGAMLG